MTKIKNSIWSKVCSFLICFAFALTLVTGVGNFAKADNESVSERGLLFINLMYGIGTGKYNQNGTYSTDMMADTSTQPYLFGSEVKSLTINDRIMKAMKLYDDEVNGLTPADKLESSVMASKSDLEKIMADVYSEVITVRATIATELYDLSVDDYSVVYADKETFDAVTAQIENLDGNQRAFLEDYIYFEETATTTIYDDIYVVVKEKLDALYAEINAVIEEINVELGAMLDENPFDYANKERIGEIVKRYDRTECERAPAHLLSILHRRSYYLKGEPREVNLL